MFQVLEYQFPLDSEIIKNWQARFGDFSFHNDWKQIDKNKPIICTGDLKHENVRYWLTHQYPVIYGARGYVGNHKFKNRNYWFNRFNINGWANIEMRDFPYSRWHQMGLIKHPWKVKEVKRVLLAPSKMTTDVWVGTNSSNWATSMIDKFPGAEVKIRHKGETPGLRWQTLWEDLDWADLVVSLSSAITVEAFWYGKKVISLFPCNTWAAGCGSTLDDWQNPNEPELRDQWHEHLAWSQYAGPEWTSGDAIDEILKYFGPLTSYQHRYNYNFFTNS
jgi:hypothetical protein